MPQTVDIGVTVCAVVNRPAFLGDDDALARGVAIGRYLVQGLVGRGSMGDVYVAHDPQLNRKVAIKLLRHRTDDSAAREENRRSLMREAQSIARLSHPNVVVIHDVGTFEDRVFIAMEFVEGYTAGYWLLAERRPWTEVLSLFMAAGRGLAAAHDKGLVHRDFKPENVMVGTDGQVRVMDFGLAGFIYPDGLPESGAHVAPAILPTSAAVEFDCDDLDVTRALGTWTVPAEPGTASATHPDPPNSAVISGTPAYMAPEQFQGGPTDGRTDQFSFCVALYQGLYGESPFAGSTLLARWENVGQGRVREAPSSSRVPAWIRKVLLRGLQVKPDQRWPSMHALLAGLDQNARRLAEIDEWLEMRQKP